MSRGAGRGQSESALRLSLPIPPVKEFPQLSQTLPEEEGRPEKEPEAQSCETPEATDRLRVPFWVRVETSRVLSRAVACSHL